ncbi:MAG TPA: ABC transporter permease [Chloroflexota bacterium]|nr:ABC transporter permease [Chloroflexota bacterium]
MEVYGEVARENVAVAAEAVDAAQLAEAAEVQPGRRASLWRDAGRRLLRNKLAVAGLIGVCVLVFLAVFADVISPYPYDYQDFLHINEEPSWQFPLGTDLVGRDMLSRVIYGARVSLSVSLLSQIVILCIAVPLGALAGYRGGWVDMLVMRMVDVFYAIPSLLLAILIMSMLGRGIENLFIALIVTGWLTLTRLTRAQVLTLRDKEYVKAARTAGAGPLRIIVRHILPNALTPIVVAVTFGIPQLIFAEAALSFIGIGVNPPMPSWGQMVGEHQQYLRSSWWLAVFPTAAIALTMLSFTFLGDGIRDALDPRMND